MSTELEAALAVVIRRLGSIAVTNPELIAELRQLAQRFLKLTEPPAVEEPGTTEQVAEAVPTQAAEVPAEPAAPAVPTPRYELLPTVPGVEVPVGWARRVGVSDADLQLIENRRRLKAEGARWAATRQRRINEGADYYLEKLEKVAELLEGKKVVPIGGDRRPHAYEALKSAFGLRRAMRLRRYVPKRIPQ